MISKGRFAGARGLVLSAVLGVAVQVLCGCGTKSGGEGTATASSAEHETVVREALSSIDECSALLSGVTDAISATAARPKLEAALPRLQETGSRLDGLAELPEAVRKRLDAKYGRALDERATRFTAETGRVARIPGAAAVLAGSVNKGGDSEPSLLDEAAKKLEALKKKIRKKFEVRTGSGGGAVRG